MLYLVGGSGDLPHNWVYDGRVNLIMDNLLAEGKVVPMLIAIPNNQVIHRNNPRHVELTFPTFEAELRQHVIPLVERQYGVQASPKGRALAGLSMGGRHTMFVGFKSLDLFGSFGVLSAGDVDSEKSLASFLNDPGVNGKVDYLFVGQGTEEAKGRMGERCVALHDALTRHQIDARVLCRRPTVATTGPRGAISSTSGSCLASGGLRPLQHPIPTGESRPARTNVLGAEFPRVTAGSRVVFRFTAPSAQRVQADIMGTRHEMARDGAGVWTVTTPPLVPGFHYYQLVVDGTSINDPGSHTFFGVSKDFSGIEIPENGADYYLPRDVPHGQVRSVWYRSAVTGDWRRCIVYTPPEYDASPASRWTTAASVTSTSSRPARPTNG